MYSEVIFICSILKIRKSFSYSWLVLTKEQEQENQVKRSHFSYQGHSWCKCLPKFWNFMYNQFNYCQIKVILTICSSDVNFNRSIIKIDCIGHSQLRNCLCRSSGCWDREVRAAGCLKTVENGCWVHKMDIYKKGCCTLPNWVRAAS